MAIYELVSIDRIIGTNGVTASNFSENGGIVKVPSIEMVKSAISGDACAFTVALNHEVVCGFIWGVYDFFSSGELFNSFSRCGEHAEGYDALFEHLGRNVTSYGADLMIAPRYQKSFLSYILHQRFLESLEAKGKKYLIFMIENIEFMSKNRKTIIVNLKNQASINLHRKLGARVVKTVRDLVEISGGATVGRRCDYYLLDVP